MLLYRSRGPGGWRRAACVDSCCGEGRNNADIEWGIALVCNGQVGVYLSAKLGKLEMAAGFGLLTLGEAGCDSGVRKEALDLGKELSGKGLVLGICCAPIVGG